MTNYYIVLNVYDMIIDAMLGYRDYKKTTRFQLITSCGLVWRVL